MPKASADDLYVKWKLSIPATLSGRVSHMLQDPLHNKPIYGARVKLVSELLEWWVSREMGTEPPHISTLAELRNHA